MPSPALQKYLSHLVATPGASTNLWLDEEGAARGRYFNSTLTSAFQPIRAVSAVSPDSEIMSDLPVIGYEGYARSYAANDQGLNVWRLLDHAANDDESIELDRLCRILHAINFYRQAGAGDKDLYLTVHTRLLAAVEGNHGAAFRRILDILELPHQHIVLQLPQIVPSQRWVLNHVADNYQRNGFRIGINAADTPQALELLERIRPHVIKLDANHAPQSALQNELLLQTARTGSRVVFKRVESQGKLDELTQSASGKEIFVQGFLLDIPKANLKTDSDFVSSTPATQAAAA